MYHNSLLAMDQGPYRTFLTIRKQFYFPNMLPKIQNILMRAHCVNKQSQRIQNKDHIMGAFPLSMSRVNIWQLT